MSNYISLSLNESASVILDAWQSDPNTAPLLIGPPGIGKTELVRDLCHAAAQMLAPDLIARGVLVDPRPGGTGLFPAWHLSALEIAHCADEDVGGIPVRDAVSGAVKRLPIGPLRDASERPSIFFGDETSRGGAQKQGCLLTLTNEGRAGDFKFHPGTRSVLAANGAESSGTHSIIDALLNRCLVIEVHAVVAEVIHYLMNRVGAQGSSLRELAIDYAMTSEKAAGLIAVDPPQGATEAGLLWASPRAIVKSLKVFDTALKNGRTGDVLFASLAGLIGKDAAGTYLAIRKVRDRLPSVDEISTNPNQAKVPDAGDTEANIGVLGLAAVAASRNANNAWVYAGRLQNKECGVALTRGLLKFPPTSPEALKVKMLMMGRVGMANEA